MGKPLRWINHKKPAMVHKKLSSCPEKKFQAVVSPAGAFVEGLVGHKSAPSFPVGRIHQHNIAQGTSVRHALHKIMAKKGAAL